MTTSALMTQISLLPDNMKEQVADFVSFLLEKTKSRQAQVKERRFGYGMGSFEMAPNFDAPLDEFNEYTE